MSWLSLVGQVAPVLASGASSIQSLLGARAARQSGADLSAMYRQQGEIEARALRIEAARRRGVVRASAAASGVDPNRGSVADILAENAYFDELNAQIVEHNASLKAQRARLDGDALAAQGAGAAGQTILDQALRSLRGLGPKPSALPTHPSYTAPWTPPNPANITGYKMPGAP